MGVQVTLSGCLEDQHSTDNDNLVVMQLEENEGKIAKVKSIETAFYAIKQALDESGETACNVTLPPINADHADSIVESVFVKKYDIKIFYNDELVPIYRSGGEVITSFLKSLPSAQPMQIFKSDSLDTNGVVHGFTTRFGGISTHPKQKSLNLCFGDKKHDTKIIVKENRRRLCEEINADVEKFFVAKATHGNGVWVYEEVMPTDGFDGIICQTPGVVIAAPAADCNTIILLDNKRRCCGAIHAGWKGILNGVIKSTIQSMIEHYKCNPQDIIAVIGPSLSVCCCEFSQNDAEKFLSVDEDCIEWREGHPKPFVDLRKAASTQLCAEGIPNGNIGGIEICTKCDDKFRFFSYRRMGLGFGTHVGFIGILRTL